MTTLHLPAQGYTTLPWKNGSGSTDEIWLWPPDATREAFSIRISRAPITTRGVFSSFPGADRAITLIEGQGLALEFDEIRQELAPLAPFLFDTGRAPIGDPLAGPVRVFNVMAKRAEWRLTGAALAAPGTAFAADLSVIFALEPQGITTATGRFDLAAQDTLVTPEAGQVEGRALIVSLARAV
ncbi:HutD/Ves family protein [Paracoccus aminophilus]|nr:HutD family protein [Paracoccus aminophilus]